jgi:hypothetical protein
VVAPLQIYGKLSTSQSIFIIILLLWQFLFPTKIPPVIFFPDSLSPPANPPPAVPAIHRGHLPSPEQSPARGAAHDATNLFRRGHYTLLEGIAEGYLAHGELQEPLPMQCKGR